MVLYSRYMGKKVELKTKKNNASVAQFIKSIEDSTQRKDAKVIAEMMEKITKAKPKMWGTSIVGFGDWHYKSPATGREGDWFVVGFSPRKQNMTLYIMPGYQDFGPLLEKLGPHKLGKSCLYIKRLDDIHIPTLKKIISEGVKIMKKKYQ